MPPSQVQVSNAWQDAIMRMNGVLLLGMARPHDRAPQRCTPGGREGRASLPASASEQRRWHSATPRKASHCRTSTLRPSQRRIARSADGGSALRKCQLSRAGLRAKALMCLVDVELNFGLFQCGYHVVLPGQLEAALSIDFKQPNHVFQPCQHA